MDKHERLAMAVGARIASIRADQALERSVLLERKFAPVEKAIDAYTKLHGEDADPSDRFDVLMSLIVQHGGGDLGAADILEGMAMHEERGAANRDAAEAVRALGDAMGGHQDSILKWVGCTRKEFVSAVEAKLTD